LFAFVGGIILALCVLDYLSFLRNKYPAAPNGQFPIGKNYKALVTLYLKKYRAEWVYALRCALVHSYAASDAMKAAKMLGFGFNHCNRPFHLSGTDPYLRLNVEDFVADVVWAAKEFFEHPPTTTASILKRATGLLVVLSPTTNASGPYSAMDVALAELDRTPPDFARLRGDIEAIICPPLIASTTTAAPSGVIT